MRAQTPVNMGYGGIGDPAIAPGTPASSYALSNVDHVNYYNGNLNVSIPILTIGGRGTVARPIAIPIERHWEAYTDGDGVYGAGSNLWTMMSGYYTSGFISVETTSAYPNTCLLQDQYGSYYWEGVGPFLTYIVWHGVGGTETYLRDTKYNGQPQGADITTCSQLPSSLPNRGRVFHSFDGSEISFVADADVIDGQGSPSPTGTLITRDGTRYRLPSGYVSQIEDRNGNLINFASQSTFSGGIYTITDPVGRTESINFTEDLIHNQQDVITYPGFNGTSRTVTVNYGLLQNSLASNQSLQTYHCLFPELSGGSSSTTFNPYIVASIALPDGTSYAMKYNSYGELAELTLPTGAKYTYTYPEATSCTAGTGSGVITLDNNSGYRIRRYVSERDEYADGTNLSAKILFSYVSAADPNHSTRPGELTTVTYKDKNGQVLRVEKHYFYGDPASTKPPITDSTKYADWWEGLEFKSEVDNSSGAALQTTQQVWQQRPCASGEYCWYVPADDDQAPLQDPQMCQSNTTLDGQTSGVVNQFDQYNNVTYKREYDYGSAPAIGASCPASPPVGTRETWMTYQTASPYSDPNVHILNLPSLIAMQPSHGAYGYTTFSYDQTPPANASGIVGHDANYGTGFTARGNLTQISKWSSSRNAWLNTQLAYDIAGNVVSTSDAASHVTTLQYNDPQSTYAHATKVTNALNQSTTAQYDYYSGKRTSVIDANGVSTVYQYNDPLDRLTLISQANGIANVESHTTYWYDGPMHVAQFRDQTSMGDGKLRDDTLYDGLGRPIESRTSETASQYISTFTTYDALGRVASTSNPIRNTSGSAEYTTFAYDSLGRPTQTVAPDGSTTSTAYSGNTATVTDPAGTAVRTTTDAFGRATKVEENRSGSVFAYSTQYVYDPLGDLTKVTQGSQTRTFNYDNQGWLQSTTQPESGTTSYTYDAVGNVATKKDSRQITTSFSYDALNRLTQKNYSDNTQAVSYTYDAASVPYSIGRLTQMFSLGTFTNNDAFDPLGNVVTSSQLTAGGKYIFNYTYNLSSALISEMLPSGRKLTYGYDGTGRENLLSGTIGGQAKNYVSSVSYTPAGQESLIAYGNNVWRATNYNNRLQPYQTKDMINDDPAKLVRTQCFYWGSANNLQACTNPANTDNNGNLRATMLGYGTGGTTTSINFNETFTYDGVNRLTGVTDDGGWSRTFGYDQYGNMWVPSTTGIPLQGGTVATVNNYDAASNRINGASYDAAGNLTSFTGSALTYDAENRITSATQSGIGSMFYYYDGAGRRVQEVSTYSTEKVFVYDVFGQLSAEYSVGMPAPPCTTCYIATDHLGSTRLVTDQSGNTVGRHDFLPFGEEIAANSGGRDDTFGTQDFVNQKFTGQERDAETGLDFFHARYFSAALGRFNSPDPANVGADLFKPQSWNGYTYVNNNPLTLIDPTGLTTCDGNGNHCYDSITVPGGAPDPALTDPCFLFHCWGGGFGYYWSLQQVLLPLPIVPAKNWVSFPVVRNFSRTFPCSSNAAQVMSALENNFASFGDNSGGTGLSTFSIFTPGPVSPGEKLTINVGLQASGHTYAYNDVSVVVQSATSSSLVFQSTPNHVLYPASVAFSASNAGNGAITFTTSVNARTNGVSGSFKFLFGGRAGETSTWNNLLNQVSKFCGN
jgi:RHS repeat-associated protein